MIHVDKYDVWYYIAEISIWSVADKEGGQAPPPPLQTQAYTEYYLEGKWMNNLSKYLLNLIKKVQFFSKFSTRFAHPSFLTHFTHLEF